MDAYFEHQIQKVLQQDMPHHRQKESSDIYIENVALNKQTKWEGLSSCRGSGENSLVIDGGIR